MTQPTELPESNSNLTVQDLLLVVQIIQIASARGTFKAEELANVGGLYNKLVTFLESVGALTRSDNKEGA